MFFKIFTYCLVQSTSILILNLLYYMNCTIIPGLQILQLQEEVSRSSLYLNFNFQMYVGTFFCLSVNLHSSCNQYIIMVLSGIVLVYTKSDKKLKNLSRFITLKTFMICCLYYIAGISFILGKSILAIFSSFPFSRNGKKKLQ